MPRHILAATDGSELADHAIAYGSDLAAKLSAQLTIVTVSELWSPSEIANRVGGGQVNAVAEFEQHAAELAQKILTRARELAGKHGIQAKTLHIADAKPADGILQAAREVDADMIVMSSHGRRGLSRLIMGSQAQEVVANSKLPVLICK